MQVSKMSGAIAPSLIGPGTILFLPSSDVRVPTRTGNTSGCTITGFGHAEGTPLTGRRSVASPVLTEPRSIAAAEARPGVPWAFREKSGESETVRPATRARIASELGMTWPPVYKAMPNGKCPLPKRQRLSLGRESNGHEGGLSGPENNTRLGYEQCGTG